MIRNRDVGREGARDGVVGEMVVQYCGRGCAFKAVDDRVGVGDACVGQSVCRERSAEGFQGLVSDGDGAEGDREEHLAQGQDTSGGRGGVIFGMSRLAG